MGQELLLTTWTQVVKATIFSEQSQKVLFLKKLEKYTRKERVGCTPVGTRMDNWAGLLRHTSSYLQTSTK